MFYGAKLCNACIYGLKDMTCPSTLHVNYIDFYVKYYFNRIRNVTEDHSTCKLCNIA